MKKWAVAANVVLFLGAAFAVPLLARALAIPFTRAVAVGIVWSVGLGATRRLFWEIARP